MSTSSAGLYHYDEGAEPPASSSPAPPQPGAPRRRPRWLGVAGAIVVVAALVTGLLVWAPWAAPAPAAPTALHEGAKTATSVVVSWTSSSREPSAQRYLIVRDGTEVGSVPASSTTYRDGGLRPGTTHRYQVVAVADNVRSARSEGLSVTMLAPSPVRLAGRAITTAAASITWSPPPNSPRPDGYEILRDGQRVATLSGVTNSYTDSGLEVRSSHRYEVVARWGSERSKPSTSLSVRTLAPAPVQVRASKVTATSVVLAWSAPPNMPKPDRYVIARNGRQVGSVPGVRLMYTDTGLAASALYRYQVSAIWGAERSTASSALSISTRAWDAAVQGSYTVHLKFVATPGGGASGTVGQTWTDTWKFTPTCATAACDVKVAGGLAPPGFTYHSFTVTLHRAGTVYTGNAAAHLTYCGGIAGIPGTGTAVQNTVSLRLTSPQGGIWPSWSGTMVVDAPYTVVGLYYCPTQSWTISLSATR